MENKNQLTEDLKVLEIELQNDKYDLKSLNSKLEIAYKYEEELILRMNAARIKTEEIRKQFFIKSGEIVEKHKKMKGILDIYTANFFLT